LLDREHPEVLILLRHKVRNQPRFATVKPSGEAAPMSMFISPAERARPNTAENKPRAAP
jgi:hypothetical protein